MSADLTVEDGGFIQSGADVRITSDDVDVTGRVTGQSVVVHAASLIVNEVLSGGVSSSSGVIFASNNLD